MPWRSDTTFLAGLDVFTGTLSGLEQTDWRRPSPCADWSALDILGHVGTAVRFGTALLDGNPVRWEPADPPGAAVEGDAPSWWSGIAGPAREAARGVDLARQVDTPMGRRSIDEGLAFPALDLFVHAWDLGRSIGLEVHVPPEAIEFARSRLGAIPDEQLRSARVFAQEVEAPPDATPTERFIAWTGRDPRWAPPKA